MNGLLTIIIFFGAFSFVLGEDATITVNILPKVHEKVLLEAVYFDDAETLVQKLPTLAAIDQFYQFPSVGPQTKATLLGYAAAAGKSNIVSKLLNIGADPFIPSKIDEWMTGLPIDMCYDGRRDPPYQACVDSLAHAMKNTNCVAATNLWDAIFTRRPYLRESGCLVLGLEQSSSEDNFYIFSNGTLTTPKKTKHAESSCFIPDYMSFHDTDLSSVRTILRTDSMQLRISPLTIDVKNLKEAESFFADGVSIVLIDVCHKSDIKIFNQFIHVIFAFGKFHQKSILINRRPIFCYIQ